LIERVGAGTTMGRRLYAGYLDRLEDWPDELGLAGSRFVLFLAADTTGLDDETIRRSAAKALGQGAAYVCTWGPGCSWAHDLFDLEIMKVDPKLEGPFVLTTWHDDDTLDEALWFAVFVAYPGDERLEDCDATLAVAVGHREWHEQIRTRLRDPGALDDDVAV
jgi:hypothetical protein